MADLRLGVAISRATVAEARARGGRGDDLDPGRHRGGRRRPARHADDPAVGPAALRLPRRPGAGARRLRPRQHGRGDRPRPGRRSGAVVDGALRRGRDQPRRPGVPGRGSERGRGAARTARGRRGAVPGRGARRARRTSASPACRTSSRAARRRRGRMPKAARLTMAADAVDARSRRARPRSRSRSPSRSGSPEVAAAGRDSAAAGRTAGAARPRPGSSRRRSPSSPSPNALSDRPSCATQGRLALAVAGRVDHPQVVRAAVAEQVAAVEAALAGRRARRPRR